MRSVGSIPRNPGPVWFAVPDGQPVKPTSSFSAKKALSRRWRVLFDRPSLNCLKICCAISFCPRALPMPTGPCQLACSCQNPLSPRSGFLDVHF